MSQVIIQPALDDAYVNSASPGSNFNSSTVLWMGKYNTGTVYRTLARFDLSSIVGSASIINAKLRLYVDSATNPGVTANITPYIITEAWSKSSITWNSTPMYDVTIAGETVGVTGTLRWYEWDVTTIVSAWFNAVYPNWGIILKSDETTNSSSKRAIRSNDNTAAHISLRPTLIVQYEPIPIGGNVVITGRDFTNQNLSATTGDDYLFTTGFDISQKIQVSFFVNNTGSNSATAKLEISPNDSDYMIDGIEVEVPPGEMKWLVPMIFANYIRLGYKSTSSGNSTSIDLAFQAQV